MRSKTTPKKPLRKKIKAINPSVPIVRIEYSRIDPKEIPNVQAFNLKRVLDFQPEFLDDPDAEHQHDTTVISLLTNVATLRISRLSYKRKAAYGS